MSRGEPSVSPGLSGALLRNDASGNRVAGIPATCWTRIPANPCAWLASRFVVSRRIARLFATQFARAPRPPEKKLSEVVGSLAGASATAKSVRAIRTTIIAARNGRAVRFIDAPVEFRCGDAAGRVTLRGERLRLGDR